MEQVITVTKDGGMEGLQHKRGQGIDLRQFGHVSIQRSTMVEWEEITQTWIVRFITPLECPLPSGTSLRKRQRYAYISHSLLGRLFGPPYDAQSSLGCVHFNEYEEAVDCEIKVLNEARRKGWMNYA